MQKVRGRPRPLRAIGLPLLVDARFQVLLTPLIAVLFTFQSPYLFTIGRPGVLSLGGWSPRLRTAFHEHRATLGILSTEGHVRRIRDCHPLWSAFPDRSAERAFVTPQGPTTPGTNSAGRRRPRKKGGGRTARELMPGLGCIRLRSPLLTESRLISFPPGTKMFQFPGLAPTHYAFMRRSRHLIAQWRGVAPFRDLRIKACLPAPRSLSQAAASFVASGRLGIHRAPLRS